MAEMTEGQRAALAQCDAEQAKVAKAEQVEREAYANSQSNPSTVSRLAYRRAQDALEIAWEGYEAAAAKFKAASK